MPDQILVFRRDAARSLSISVRSLDYLIAGGELSPVRRIGRRILIARKTLENFAMRDHATGPNAKAAQ